MNFDLCRQISENVSRVMVGKERAVELLLVALLSEGHVLIEDVPGVGKTMLAKALARSIGGEFKRVQFTPDLLPSDITGFSIFDPKSRRFTFQTGPVMTHILLADEINRTVPRTQASMLESMEERQVTVDGNTHELPRPFFVMATQNPIELEGTFPLPEAQMDRFLLKIHLGYPNLAEEIAILERFQRDDHLENLTPVAEPEQITAMQTLRRQIRIMPPVRSYIAQITHATRDHPDVKFGVSPRGSLSLMKAAQAQAALSGRDHTVPDDVKKLVSAVLAHRMVLKEQVRMKGVTADDVLKQVLKSVAVPTQ